MKSIKCKSGLKGWKANLQENYSDFEEFEQYDNVYGLAVRLGFNTAREAWEANPLVEGSVEPSDFQLSGRIDRILARLDDFTKGYLECALWSSSDSEHDLESLDRFGFDDIDPDSLEKMEKECKEFQEKNKALLVQAYALDYAPAPKENPSYAGHDFWLTRQGHGTGFWDRGLGEAGDQLSTACGFSSCGLYVGDDGKVYAE